MKMPSRQQDRAIPAGVFAAAITPRREGETEVDLGGMLEMIDFVGSRGAAGLALFSAAGEFLHFTQQERCRFIALATKRSRIPVIANVSHSTLDGAIAMAEEAAGSGVSGVMVMPPYFFRYENDWIRAFYLEFGAQLSKWTPIYIDNLPDFTNAIDIGIAEELLRSGHFAGIVDSSGDRDYIGRLIRLGAELSVAVLCGEDRLLAHALHAGAQGSVSVIAAAVPELPVALHRASAAGDLPAVSRLQQRMEEFGSWIGRFPSPVGIREAAALRGVKTGGPAIPPGPFSRALLDDFRSWFAPWIEVVEHECKANT
jgi:4-hydroxy-tetrahydrodipicolinate synthase